MKKPGIKQLALLGLANGLLFNAPSNLSAQQANDAASIENLNRSAHGYIAAGCKGKNGCGNTVASSCGGKNGCSSAVASSCKGGCGAIAAREISEDTKLQDPSKVNAGEYAEANSSNLGYHLMTEDELLLEMNDAGVKQYKALSPEGQALARKLASQRCAGTNDCKGENACKTEKNSCAGKGGCKGTTKCALSDKNLAVKLAADKMAAKRNEAMQGNRK